MEKDMLGHMIVFRNAIIDSGESDNAEKQQISNPVIQAMNSENEELKSYVYCVVAYNILTFVLFVGTTYGSVALLQAFNV